ncbi:hypothetical protein NKI38_20080 [Mesorhizobium sp. M0621]|uniref:hypothetical protein n=1 Tax=Mesorhizobium sp. M0621 TaxID=2956974 RepID=UPI003338EFDF
MLGLTQADLAKQAGLSTPAPAPSSGMNSTPADSRADWIALSVDALGSVLPLSILFNPVA